MKFRLETFHRNVSREALIEDLRKVHALLKPENKKLTFRSYGKHGKYSAGTIAERFGGCNTTLEAAPIDATLRRDVPVDDLFDNLRSVWIAKGREPVFRDMGRPPSQYVASTYAGHPGLVLEIDHIQAWSKGGETFEENLQTLCYDCNRGKSDLKDR